MKKSAMCVLAVLAAAVSTSAVAKDLKQNKQAVSATQMTNSEMDKVTAGAPGLPAPGNAWGRGRGFGFDGHGGAKGQGGTVGHNNSNGRF